MDRDSWCWAHGVRRRLSLAVGMMQPQGCSGWGWLRAAQPAMIKLLATLDKHVASAREALSKTTDNFLLTRFPKSPARRVVASVRIRKHLFRTIIWRTAVGLLIEVVRFVSVGFRSRSQLAAENLFLRKQQALCRD